MEKPYVYRGNPQDGFYFHEQNNDKRSKANKDQGFCFCTGFEKSRLIGMAPQLESRFKIFLNFSYEEELTDSFISF